MPKGSSLPRTIPAPWHGASFRPPPMSNVRHPMGSISPANALLLFCLGAERSGGYQPAGFNTRLQSAYSKASSDERAFISRVLAQDWTPDWEQNSLAKEERRFAEHLAREFPDLELVTAQALANHWSHGWR